MFSEELKILGRNTVHYMIDEMQKELNEKELELEKIRGEKETALRRIAELEQQMQVQPLSKI